MPEQKRSTILTLNSGSSSVKFAVYRMSNAEELVTQGSLQRIGLDGGLFHADDGHGNVLIDEPRKFPDHASALSALIAWLGEQPKWEPLSAVGHRVVQGGPTLTQPCLITPQILEELRRVIPLAPDHSPSEIRAIEEIARAYPRLPQAACFDTAFHRTLPDFARRFALPRRFQDEGIERYGFHGLSYQYIVEALRREAGPAVANGRLVIAHLGNGASMAAVRDGKSLDTTMGLTPLGGLVMGNRCGDLDPGVVLYLLREKGLDADQVDELLNKHSGLLGVSGSSPDMHDLLRDAAADSRAAEAIDLFCYQARKFVAAMAAALGGLDTLIFTAGIGEHAGAVRDKICAELAFLGIRVDPTRNAANAPMISPDGASVAVRVMKTNEELMIARQTFALSNGVH